MATWLRASLLPYMAGRVDKLGSAGVVAGGELGNCSHRAVRAYVWCEQVLCVQ